MTIMPFFDGRTGQVHFRHWPAAGGAVGVAQGLGVHRTAGAEGHLTTHSVLTSGSDRVFQYNAERKGEGQKRQPEVSLSSDLT